MDRRARLQTARLYLIASDRPGGRPLADVLGPALEGGVDLFQLRCKDAADETVLAASEVARELCAAAGALFFVNDRPDLAAAAGADGVHVGQDDMPVSRARQIVGADRLVGLSTHAPAEVDAADADLIGVGPVHATPTKAGRPAVGLELVRHAAAHARVPWFAIGGIDEDNAAAVIGAGAARISVVRAIADAPDPRAAAYRLRRMVETVALHHGPAHAA
ncbi:thiamine phosphate synthase [Capillimicrobium parvum]|uniref:Thiamine-phosphate synthase n=1 Tax=Capillimicrobium parvum TaxID=2884022 RepID=A0A9E6XSJ5_9ACTN|nr:thiamine phosphate synthase [Capillimicrobium parvum]UGS33939.1 Thiamine-phosphate synthase [Capillimicrobium parvum]